MKSQFIAIEPLLITFPPFFDRNNEAFVEAGDAVTVTVKAPNGSLISPAPLMTRDPDTKFWQGQIDVVDYQSGEWTVRASSDAPDTLPQYANLTWGDYMNEIRQAAYGRWRINGTTLEIYEDDGTTLIKTFDLRDSAGLPSATQIFERTPV